MPVPQNHARSGSRSPTPRAVFGKSRAKSWDHVLGEMGEEAKALSELLDRHEAEGRARREAREQVMDEELHRAAEADRDEYPDSPATPGSGRAPPRSSPLVESPSATYVPAGLAYHQSSAVSPLGSSFAGSSNGRSVPSSRT